MFTKNDMRATSFKLKQLLFLLSLCIGLLALKLSGDLPLDIVGLSFLLTCMQTVFFLSYIGGHEISLVRIYFIFNLIFFSVTPWIHYSEDALFWSSKPFLVVDYLIGNAIIFLSNALVAAIYIMKKNSVSRLTPLRIQKAAISARPGAFFALLALSGGSLLILLYYNNFAFKQLFFRGVSEEINQLSEMASPQALLSNTLGRLLPLFCFIYSTVQIRGSRWLKIILFLILVMVAFPTGIPRYMVAFIYIPILLLYFKKFRGGLTFSFVIVASIIFIFPFLDQFRYFKSITDLRLTPSKEFFLAAHFDAYQNFIRVIQIDYTTYGRQLSGVLLFFIPRSWWSEKPIGSGSALAEHAEYFFSNISMPFIGEGFVNFGLAGVFLFSAVAAYLMAKLDKKFQNLVTVDSFVGYNAAIYFFLCAALTFLLRGDLLSSTAYILAGVFSAFVVRKICDFSNRI